MTQRHTIDAHVHVWDRSRAEYPWLGPEAGALYRDVSIADVEAELDAAAIDGCVLVQAADSDDDTDLMFDAASSSDRVRGIVAWVPLDDPGRAEQRLAELARRPLFCGVRALIHENPDPGFLTSAEVDPTLALLAAHGIPLDVPAVLPEHLRAVVAVSERHPDLPVVIDHLGHPPIMGASPVEWSALIRAVAVNPKASAKLSGLYPVSGDPAIWSVDDLRPFVDTALDAFGPGRLMYGSDWPVALIGGGYGRVLAGVRGLVGELDAVDRASIFAGTAARVYGIDSRL